MTGPAAGDLLALYEEIDARVRAHAPVCAVSGRCCDFPVSGHTLFATGLEVEVAAAGGIPAPEAPGWCPFYRGRLCTLRALRPIGCRVYFCDPAYRDAMPEIAEWAQRRVRALHEAHEIPYRYEPFVGALDRRR